MKNKKLIAIIMSVMISTTMISGIGQPVRAEDGDTLSQSQQLSTEYTYNDLKYIIKDNNEIEISGYVGEPEEVVIPGTINGKKVTSIGFEAFRSCRSLKKIDINDNVTQIGDGAFYGCNVEEVKLPNKIERIGRYTFCYSDLIDINIPSSVKYIEDGAFDNCWGLKKVEIPEGVLIIGSAFTYCAYLKEVKIAKSVRWIDEHAFTSNYDNIKKIMGYSGGPAEEFAKIRGYNFESLGVFDLEDEEVTFNYRIKNDNTIEITGCEGLPVNIDIPSEIDGKKVTSIGNNAFKGIKTLISVKLPETLLYIGYDTFNSCEYLEEINIPSSVYGIGDGAFYGCEKLSEVTIPEGVTRLGSYVFYRCGLTEVKIPDSVTIIDNSAFQNCFDLQKVELSDNIVEINELAFDGCPIRDIKLPSKLKKIGDEAFSSYKGNNIIIPDGVEEIGNGVFEYCNLDNIVIPKSVKNIDGRLELYSGKIQNVVGYKGSYAEIYANQYKYNFIPINENYLKIKEFKLSPSGNVVINNEVSLSTIVEDGTGTGTIEYRYTILNSENEVVFDSEYSESNSAKWTPSTAGVYTVCYEVKDCLGTVLTEKKSLNVLEKVEALNVSDYKVSVASPQNVGTSINLSMSSIGGVGTHKYRFVAMKDGKVTYARDYEENNTATWTPTEAGSYTLYLKVKDETGKEVQQIINYVITNDPVITKISTSVSSPQNVGTSINLSMETTGGVGTKKYRFVAVKSDGTKPFARDFSTSNTATWTPTEPGTYTLYFKVNDDNKKDIYKMMKYVITEKPQITNTSTSVASPQKVGTSIKLDMATKGGAGTLKYRFVAVKSDGTKTFIRDYETSNSTTWTPTEPGNYALYFKAIDSTGLEIYKKVNYVVSSYVTTVNEDDSKIVYSGNWLVAKSDTATNGTMQYTFNKGASAKMVFTGTGIVLKGVKGPERGIVKVTVDDKSYYIDLYNDTYVYNTVVFENKNLSSGTHTITVECTGDYKDHGQSIKSTKVAIDGFEIVNGDLKDTTKYNVSKINEDNSKLVYTGNWLVAKNEAASNGTMKYTANKGASVKMTFTGTGIVLKGVKGPERGLLKVTIDDKVYSIDLYNTSYKYDMSLFEDKNLSAGTHTITVECLGEYNNLGQSNPSKKISVDGFEIVNGDIK